MDDIDRHRKIERYILKQMDEQEASEFEAYFLSDKECLAELEMERKLHQGLQQQADSAVMMPEITQVDNQGGASNDAAWWSRKVPVWIAAALLLFALLPSGLLYQRLHQQGLPQPEVMVLNLELAAIRSAQSSKMELQSNKVRKIVSIYIDTDVEELLYSSYGFKISRQDDPTSKLNISNIRLDSASMLYIDLGVTYLQPGIYQYEVLGLDRHRSLTIGAGSFVVNE